jgi:hypothetical protein
LPPTISVAPRRNEGNYIFATKKNEGNYKLKVNAYSFKGTLNLTQKKEVEVARKMNDAHFKYGPFNIHPTVSIFL